MTIGRGFSTVWLWQVSGGSISTCPGTFTKWREEATISGKPTPTSISPVFSPLCVSALWVILRPGPHVNAELPNFGLPQRIISNPAIQARSPAGNPVLCPFPPQPFPAPSYASSLYLEETEKWFGKVCATINDFLTEKDFIRMIQVDNEASLFFRDAPFDQDYHPEAVAMFHNWLRCQEVEPFDPPISFAAGLDGIRRGLLWIRFRQWMIVEALQTMKRFLEEKGCTEVVFTHNLPPAGTRSVVAAGEIKKALGCVTTDIYCTAEDVRTAMEQVRLITALEEKPFAGEMGTGTVFYSPYITEFDNRFVFTASLACGLKGFNLYMGVERDRWIGGLLSREGKAERSSLIHFYRRLYTILDELKLEEFTPAAPALVVIPRIYIDHSTQLFPFPGLSPTLVSGIGLHFETFLHEEESSLGADIPQRCHERLETIFEFLTKLSLFYLIGEGIEPYDRMKMRFEDLALLFVPTFIFIDPDVLRTMTEWGRKGATVVVGPRLPRLDHRLAPLSDGIVAEVESMAQKGEILFVENLAANREAMDKIERIAALFWESLPLRIVRKHPTTDIVVHRHGNGGRWLLFIINHGEEKSTTTIEFERGKTVEKLLHLFPGEGAGGLARMVWKKPKTIPIEHGGREIVLLHVY